MNITPQSGRGKLGLISLTFLVVGNMIGSGILLLPASLASFGSISILGWMITGAGAIFLALVFSDLSKRLPRTGGPYAYCREGFGDFVGFLVAYNYWLALWIGNAQVAVTLAGYVGVFWPALNEQAVGIYNPWLSFAIKAGSIWLFTGINILGVRSVARVQIVATVLKILPIVLICVFGITKIHPAYFGHFNISGQSNWMALSGAATLTLWAFIGLESATIPAGEVKNTRDISRATVYGTLFTTLIYMVSTVVLMGLIPATVLQHSQAPFADAARLLFNHELQFLIAASAVISCMGLLNGWILLQGQLPMAAAQDGLFPQIFAKCGRYGTPTGGLIIASAFSTLLLVLTVNTTLVKQFTFITLLATLAFLIPYFISTMAEIMILIKSHEPYQHKLLKPALIAAVAGIYSFWTIAGSGMEVVYYGALLFFSGVPVFVWLQWRAKRALMSQ